MLSLNLTPFSSMTANLSAVGAVTMDVGRLTVRDGLDVSGRAGWLVRSEATFGVNEVGGKDCVDQRRLSKTCLTCTR
jgi:hypothetical protein